MLPFMVPDPTAPASGSQASDVLEEQSPEALAELIHSLRQPLSTIEACAFYLSLVLPADDEKCREQVERIEQQVAEAGRILMEAARYARAESRSATNSDSPAVT
jgi:signal transduction histidine kinase